MQAGGCDFWRWCDDATTPFLSQLITDLRDKVWDLTKENEKLKASITETREQLDKMLDSRAEVVELRREVAEKDVHILAISGRMMKAEKQRRMLNWALFACMCLFMLNWALFAS